MRDRYRGRFRCLPEGEAARERRAGPRPVLRGGGAGPVARRRGGAGGRRSGLPGHRRSGGLRERAARRGRHGSQPVRAAPRPGPAPPGPSDTEPGAAPALPRPCSPSPGLLCCPARPAVLSSHVPWPRPCPGNLGSSVPSLLRRPAGGGRGAAGGSQPGDLGRGEASGVAQSLCLTHGVRGQCFPPRPLLYFTIPRGNAVVRTSTLETCVHCRLSSAVQWATASETAQSTRSFFIYHGSCHGGMC